LCKKASAIVQQKKIDRKKIYRYFTNVGVTELDRLYIGEDKELRKEWEKEIIEENEGRK
jgi:hypothetical protein